MASKTSKASQVLLATADTELGLVPSKTASAQAQKAANEEGKSVTVRHPVTDKVLATIMPQRAKAKPAAKPAAEITDDLGIPEFLKRKPAPAKTNGSGKPAMKAKPEVTKEQKTMPKIAKTPKAAKAAKPAKATKPAKTNGDRKPSGMVIKILAMASRKSGVTPAELNKLTTWKGAPWKWLFSNPKGNGYCDRWNYKFKVERGDDGETRYFATAK